MSSIAESIWLADHQDMGADAGLRFDSCGIAPIRHSLAPHPLLQYSRLHELAQSLSGSRHIRLAARDATIKTPFKPLTEAEAGQTIADAFENIHLPGTWIALYNLEELPAYRKLICDVLDDVLRAMNPVDAGFIEFGGFIFIAGPKAVWPFHFDRENNFHIHVKGAKDYKIWAPGDRGAISAPAIEKVIAHSDYEDVRYKDEIGLRCRNFALRAGEGLHIPSTSALSISTPEVPDPAGGPAISMALTYCTKATRRVACIHTANGFLRARFGVNPRFPGKSPLGDAMKYPLGRVLMIARRMGWVR